MKMADFDFRDYSDEYISFEEFKQTDAYKSMDVWEKEAVKDAEKARQDIERAQEADRGSGSYILDSLNTFLEGVAQWIPGF